jgi:hypothetical protein
MGASGFPGNRLEPMRAGMTATIFIWVPSRAVYAINAAGGCSVEVAHQSGNQIKGAIASSGHARVESLGKEMSIMPDS